LSVAASVVVALAFAPDTVSAFNGYQCTIQLYKNFHVHWSIDKKNTTVNFTVSANTTGWVGLGLSHEAQISMKKADIYIFGVYNNNPYISDCFGTDNTRPSVDLTQNVKVLKAVEKNGWTNVTFTRGILSSDKLQDVNITQQRMTLIGALGDKDYEGNTQDPNKHPYHLQKPNKRFGTQLSLYNACGEKGNVGVNHQEKKEEKKPKFGHMIDPQHVKRAERRKHMVPIAARGKHLIPIHNRI